MQPDPRRTDLWNALNDSENIWGVLVDVRKMMRELSEEHYGYEDALGRGQVVVFFSREEFQAVQKAAQSSQCEVAEWLHGVAVYDSAAPLNVRVEIDQDDLALISEAAGSAHAAAEYMRMESLRAAFDALTKNEYPKERTIEEMRKFVITMLHRTSPFSLDEIGYTQALKDVLFWIDHPEVVMYHLPPEQA